MDSVRANETMNTIALARQQNVVMQKRFGLARKVICEYRGHQVDQVYRVRVVDSMGDEAGHWELMCEECRNDLKKELQHG
jgi:hypothetical protein